MALAMSICAFMHQNCKSLASHIFMFSLPNNSILLRILSNQSKQVCNIENLLAIEVKKTCSCTTSHAIKNFKRLE